MLLLEIVALLMLIIHDRQCQRPEVCATAISVQTVFAPPGSSASTPEAPVLRLDPRPLGRAITLVEPLGDDPWYARLLVEALDPAEVSRPLGGVLAHV